MHLVAISQAQVDLSPHLPWRAVVHNSLHTTRHPVPGGEGRFSRLARPDVARTRRRTWPLISPRRSGRRIVLIGKCSEPDEQAYFDAEVQPRLGPDVDCHGEIGMVDKYDFLSGAAAFVFPLQWEEPFGMVLIEAMACGTPVLSLARGAIPEVVVDGVTGFVREHPEEIIDAFADLASIDPARAEPTWRRTSAPTRW